MSEAFEIHLSNGDRMFDHDSIWNLRLNTKQLITVVYKNDAVREDKGKKVLANSRSFLSNKHIPNPITNLNSNH